MSLIDLLTALRAAQGPEVTVYLVGGCVRDGLEGRPIVDLDLAVVGDALRYAHTLAEQLDGTYVPLGERHSTARVVLPSGDVRQIDCTGAPNGIDADLALRDFTVDAMAVELNGFDGDWTAAAIIDPFDGRRDLSAKVLRMVSPQAFADDPLRLLRGIRLAAELGLELEPATQAAIGEHASLITDCAGERIREELVRILAVDGAVTSLELMDHLGLLAALLPELMVGKGVAQPKEHYWDVFSHQIEAVAAIEGMVGVATERSLRERVYQHAAVALRPTHPGLDAYLQETVGTLPRIVVLKLAALLHDVAKPQTKTIQPDGRIRFFGHSEQGADIVRLVLSRLRFSAKEIEAIATMVEHHLRPGQWSDIEPSPRAMHRYFRDVGSVAIDTVLLNLADHLAARGPTLNLARWSQHIAVSQRAMEYYFDQQERAVEPRLITGNDLMESLALQPGPIVGKLLVEIEEARAIGQVATKDDALRLAKQVLVDEQLTERESATSR